MWALGIDIRDNNAMVGPGGTNGVGPWEDWHWAGTKTGRRGGTNEKTRMKCMIEVLTI